MKTVYANESLNDMVMRATEYAHGNPITVYVAMCVAFACLMWIMGNGNSVDYIGQPFAEGCAMQSRIKISKELSK